MTEKRNGVSNSIAHIMEEFDFEKVYQVMKLVDWHWREEGVPSPKRLRDEAYRLLSDLEAGKSYSLATGGFRASRDEDGMLSLEFVLEEKNSEFTDAMLEEKQRREKV